MLRQASRRNAARVRAGQVELRPGSAEALPYPDARFDRAFSINAVQFWTDRARAMQELARVLEPGGRVAIAIQPRSKGATAATAQAWGWRLAEILPAAGFGSVRLETLPLSPVPVVCALGVR
jgi:ubiquinone/menaquinone biosynthesis C-methylase UbiE